TGFFVGIAETLNTLKLTWKTDTPVWVPQWPLIDNKQSVLKNLVAEQLQKGHIKPTNSPWSAPIFIIHKKTSGTWRLLHDLRKINAVIENMGPLQPGLPNLSMIPRNWPHAIIDLKDCFFNIPLHPDDAPRFAFSVPSTNLQEPLQRYHWLVLPQGMKNSPTICQYFVVRALSPVYEQFPQSVILHYMDDLLIAAPTQEQMEKTQDGGVVEIKKAGLVVSESKIQEIAPWKYLGWKLTEQSIMPQKIQVQTDVHTLQDLQQLLGEINWVRPVLGITADELAPLFNLLRGDNDIRFPRSLTPEAYTALEKITDALQTRQAHHCIPDKPFFLAVLGKELRLCGLIFQWDPSQKDLLLIIEWVFISYRLPKTILTPLEIMSQIIIKGRARLLSIAGCEFAIIYLPMQKTYFEWPM
ncbi:PREDICTED: endogenous retrovirus group K member 11 Pol protein-like, partial [Sturnus vulgaris]|uniref:endogenous retrovirus group K member 11 Pol protein-like n=1 Tax=Sturnus vulgaris TaxID=9172 RepID=UPI00071A9038